MKSRHFSFICLSCLLSVLAVASTYILIDQSARALQSVLYVAPLGDCGDADPCFSTVQAAVDAAATGDEIRVATGTYTDINTYGGLRQVVYISKTVILRGGYAITNWDASRPEINPTTLDAQRSGRVMYVTGFISPTIEGLRITGGDASGLGGLGSRLDAGGGVYIISATALISNNLIYSNTTPDRGGGIFISTSDTRLFSNRIQGNSSTAFFGIGGGLSLYFSNATLGSSVISDNIAFSGGGVALWHSDAALDRNIVSDNSATGYQGGGLYLETSDAILSENIIIRNTAEGDGGGLSVEGGDPTLIGNSIARNIAMEYGGGLCLRLCWGAKLINNQVLENHVGREGSALFIEGSSAQLVHNTIACNSGGDGSGVHVTDWFYPEAGRALSSVFLTNTILVSHTVGITVAEKNDASLEATLWGNEEWANGTDWGGLGVIVTGTVNLWGDPAFVDPNALDYHIGFGSLAIDKGVDAAVDHDIDGDDRPFDGDGDGVPEFDIGADESIEQCFLLYLPVVCRDS